MNCNIGDTVQALVPKESREWGYNPIPDGTIGTVVKFGEIDYPRISNYGKKPGFYENKSWAYVDFGEKFGVIHLGTFNLINLNPNFTRSEELFLRDLPDLPFWEGDIVSAPGDRFDRNQTICRIDYANIDRKRNDGSPWPFYEHADDIYGHGGVCSSEESWITLVERGPVWKHYHNEKIEFSSLQEEANFYDLLGFSTDIRNPKSALFVWTLEEALEALKNGIGHTIKVGDGFGFLFGDTVSRRISVYKFNDEELGKRVAAATLEGFAR